MDGERGQLTVEFAHLADRLRPRWLVWENVPGVLSIDGGGAFGTFLAMLGKFGYGFAYRILDAQHLGVPQRRRRIFVVGNLGDWRRAAAVLFERQSMSGDHPPCRETGQGATYDISPCVAASGRGFERAGDSRGQDCLIAATVSSKWSKGTGGPAGDECYNLVTHALRADGFDASEDGTGRGTPLVPVTAQTLTADMYRSGGATAGFNPGVRNCFPVGNTAVRRLTPRECERLQGFPDDYTLIDSKTADGPRYKALGNSMAVPVMRWIGQRIAMVDAL